MTGRVIGLQWIKIYKKKIIYKDTKLVNCDMKLETAISDLEVEQKEIQSNLFYIKYKIDGENNFITIATTRPETMIGDTAVAINPNDVRYKNFIGKKIIVPIVNRKVKIISDNYSRRLKPDYYLVLPWHFKKEILIREKKVRQKGTKFIFPLPKVKVV